MGGTFVTYVLAHTLLWRGEAKTDEDVPGIVRLFTSIMYPKGGKSAKERTEAEEKLLADSLDEISLVGLFNFYADPNPSFRNIIMNTGFVRI